MTNPSTASSAISSIPAGAPISRSSAAYGRATPAGGAPIVPHTSTDTAVAIHVADKAVLVYLTHAGVRGVLHRGNLSEDDGQESLRHKVRVGDSFEVVVHEYDAERDVWSVSAREYAARGVLAGLGHARGDVVNAQVVRIDEKGAELRIGGVKALLTPPDQPWAAFHVLQHVGQLDLGCVLPVRIMRWDTNTKAIQVLLPRPNRPVLPGDRAEAVVVLVRTNHIRKKAKLVHYIYAQREDGLLVRLEGNDLLDPLKSFPLGSKVPYVVQDWDPYLGVLKAELDWSAIQTPPASSLQVGSELECVALNPTERGCLCLLGDGLLGFVPRPDNGTIACGPGDVLRVRVQDVPGPTHSVALLSYVGFERACPAGEVHVAVRQPCPAESADQG